MAPADIHLAHAVATGGHALHNARHTLRFWHQWRRRALRSCIPALRKFTEMLERHLDGILSHCRFPINSGVLEGCNNKIELPRL